MKGFPRKIRPQKAFGQSPATFCRRDVLLTETGKINKEKTFEGIIKEILNIALDIHALCEIKRIHFVVGLEKFMS